MSRPTDCCRVLTAIVRSLWCALIAGLRLRFRTPLGLLVTTVELLFYVTLSALLGWPAATLVFAIFVASQVLLAAIAVYWLLARLQANSGPLLVNVSPAGQWSAP